MRLTVLAVGTRMPAWVNEGFREYQKRMPRHLGLSLVEIPAAKQRTDPERARTDEAQRILKKVSAGAESFVTLEETGRQLSSRQLADQLQAWMDSGGGVSLAIGGPDGLDKACLERSDLQWSLSRLTLPHGLVRVMLAEQLYRAWTILQGHPYHRD